MVSRSLTKRQKTRTLIKVSVSKRATEREQKAYDHFIFIACNKHCVAQHAIIVMLIVVGAAIVNRRRDFTAIKKNVVVKPIWLEMMLGRVSLRRWFSVNLNFKFQSNFFFFPSTLLSRLACESEFIRRCFVWHHFKWTDKLIHRQKNDVSAKIVSLVKIKFQFYCSQNVDKSINSGNWNKKTQTK